MRSFASRMFSTPGVGTDANIFQRWVGVKRGLVEAVGKTPLLRLKYFSEQTGCTVLAKAEFMQPSGSVKDRAALAIIEEAENSGLLKPGGTVVEGTAGNTGIGMAAICKAKGYNLIIYMPNNQSQEKIDLLKNLGAEVVTVPVAPFTDPSNYNHQARRRAESTPNAIWGNQFDNLANRLVHVKTTGPEIWEQTGGKLDAWTCASGTGGTYAGVAQFLKSKNPSIKSILADPPGSCLYSYFKTGNLERTGTGSITEGIGQGRVTENLKGAPVDDVIFIPDEKTIAMVFDLLHLEGIFVGASSALNIVAAVEVGKMLGPGHTIATILCDGAQRYQSRLFSKNWLESKGLLEHVPSKYHSSLMA